MMRFAQQGEQGMGRIGPPLARGAGLLVVLLVVAWLRAGWSSLGGWIVGTPMVLAGLWAVSGLASQLLPNLV